jgi:hypothetical protein
MPPSPLPVLPPEPAFDAPPFALDPALPPLFEPPAPPFVALPPVPPLLVAPPLPRLPALLVALPPLPVFPALEIVEPPLAEVEPACALEPPPPCALEPASDEAPALESLELGSLEEHAPSAPNPNTNAQAQPAMVLMLPRWPSARFSIDRILRWKKLETRAAGRNRRATKIALRAKHKAALLFLGLG